MSRLLLATAVAFALGAAPASAQSGSLDDVVLAAFDACMKPQAGASIADAAARLGFSPSTQAPDRYVKTMGARSLQIRRSRSPRSDGTATLTCSVGVWGGLDSNRRVTNAVTARARADGYTIPAATPGPRGGTEIIMMRGTGTAARGIQLAINDTIDPAKGAGVVIVHGWIE